MTLDNYFYELSSCLSRLSQADRDEAINYYKDYAFDAQITTYDEMTKTFGTPKNLSATIYTEVAVNAVNSKTAKKGDFANALIISLAALFSLPVTFSLFITGAALLFALGVILLAVLFAIGVTIFAFGFSAVVLFINSFTHLYPFMPSDWLLNLGTSLIMGALSGIMLICIILLSKTIFKFATIIISNIVQRRTKNA